MASIRGLGISRVAEFPGIGEFKTKIQSIVVGRLVVDSSLTPSRNFSSHISHRTLILLSYANNHPFTPSCRNTQPTNFRHPLINLFWYYSSADPLISGTYL